MNLLDVNVLVYAHRKDSSGHEQYRAWLLELINGQSAFALSEQVLASVIRITTHPRIFTQPSTRAEVLSFIEALIQPPLCRLVRPSPNHWALFLKICEQADVKGNLITDAWFAALAIESGCTWITTDRDFARFPGLTWQHPLTHDKITRNPG